MLPSDEKPANFVGLMRSINSPLTTTDENKNTSCNKSDERIAKLVEEDMELIKSISEIRNDENKKLEVLEDEVKS